MSLKENALKIAKYPTRDFIASTRRDGAKHPTNPNLYWNKASGKWIKRSKQTPTKSGSGSGLSKAAQQNLKADADQKRRQRKKYAGMTQKEINALKPQEGEGIASKRTMSTWRVDPEENKRLQKQAKTGSKETFKRGSSSGSSGSQAKDTGGTSDSDKAAWLKRTRNSPAAKSGAFKPEERWKIQKALREKKKAKLSIKNGKK